MTEKERMLAGKLYRADDPELQAENARKLALLRKIRETDDPARIRAITAEDKAYWEAQAAAYWGEREG